MYIFFTLKQTPLHFYMGSSSASKAVLYEYQPVVELTLVAHNYFSHTLDNTLIKLVMIIISEQ